MAPGLLCSLDVEDAAAARRTLESLVEWMNGLARTFSLDTAGAHDLDPCRPSRKMYSASKMIKTLALCRFVANAGSLKDVVQRSVSIVYFAFRRPLPRWPWPVPSACPKNLGPRAPRTALAI
eukprot:2277141-Pyramimonas_sp.AAC.1